MPPAFPEVERIELKEPPLELVVCQLRFPPILELTPNQPPKEFQKRLAKGYPVSRQQRAGFQVAVAGAGPVLTDSAFWGFDDMESRWTVSLGNTFLSLETRHYQNFDEFIGRFMEAFGFVRELYAVEVRERLGLRYLDRLARSKQPSLPADWPSRIQPDIIPLRRLRGQDEPQSGLLDGRFAFGDHVLAVRAAFTDAGFPGATEAELALDLDCFTERRAPLEGIDNLLRQFRALSYRAFRWVLGDLIHSFQTVGNAK
jgi:uncharacterized protein (TIGR04255 family)